MQTGISEDRVHLGAASAEGATVLQVPGNLTHNSIMSPGWDVNKQIIARGACAHSIRRQVPETDSRRFSARSGVVRRTGRLSASACHASAPRIESISTARNYSSLTFICTAAMRPCGVSCRSSLTYYGTRRSTPARYSIRPCRSTRWQQATARWRSRARSRPSCGRGAAFQEK